MSSSLDISAHSEAQIRELLRNYKLTPMTLAMKLNPRIIPARHLMYISARVAAAIKAGNRQIIISLPPRHGKSELITKNTPIWALEHFRRKNVILCSYGAELSTDFGRKVRDLISDNEHLLSVRLKKDAQRVDNWLTDQEGGMMSVGLGGPITGRGADILLIDDYIKAIKEAMSPTTREYIWNWFVTTAYTRLEPGAVVIIIATRWHYDDLIGRILRSPDEVGQWENICIPAIAEPEKGQEFDFLGRRAGEALFPERYPIERLLQLKGTLGTFFFNALFQQRPENENTQLTNVEWLKITDILPDIRDVVRVKRARVWDLAATDSGGDWTVGTHMYLDTSTDTLTIANVKREQLSPEKVEELVKATAIEDGPNCKILIEQEPGASGKALVAHFKNNVLKGYDVEGVPSNDGKVARAQPFLAAVEAGRVYLFKGPWIDHFIAEFKEFPHGDHDDQVDTAAIGYTSLSGKSTLSASWGRENLSTDPVSKVSNAILRGNPTVLDPMKHKISTGVVFGRRNRA